MADLRAAAEQVELQALKRRGFGADSGDLDEEEVLETAMQLKAQEDQRRKRKMSSKMSKFRLYSMCVRVCVCVCINVVCIHKYMQLKSQEDPRRKRALIVP